MLHGKLGCQNPEANGAPQLQQEGIQTRVINASHTVIASMSQGVFDTTKHLASLSTCALQDGEATIEVAARLSNHAPYITCTCIVGNGSRRDACMPHGVRNNHHKPMVVKKCKDGRVESRHNSHDLHVCADSWDTIPAAVYLRLVGRTFTLRSSTRWSLDFAWPSCYLVASTTSAQDCMTLHV